METFFSIWQSPDRCNKLKRRCPAKHVQVENSAPNPKPMSQNRLANGVGEAAQGGARCSAVSQEQQAAGTGDMAVSTNNGGNPNM